MSVLIHSFKVRKKHPIFGGGYRVVAYYRRYDIGQVGPYTIKDKDLAEAFASEMNHYFKGKTIERIRENLHYLEMLTIAITIELSE